MGRIHCFLVCLVSSFFLTKLNFSKDSPAPRQVGFGGDHLEIWGEGITTGPLAPFIQRYPNDDDDLPLAGSLLAKTPAPVAKGAIHGMLLFKIDFIYIL